MAILFLSNRMFLENRAGTKNGTGLNYLTKFLTVELHIIGMSMEYRTK